MNSETFHIIGGGIAGLASAIALANAGHHAVVMEKATTFEAIGAGLQLGPNAIRALQKLGAWDAVIPITTSPLEIHIRNGTNGKTLKRIPLGKPFESRFGLPYCVAHRADLVTALLEVAKSKSQITIKSNCEILDHTKYGNVIAADGVWSKTRQAMFPNSAANITSEVFYRALLPVADAECVILWLFPGGHVVHYPIGQPANLNLVAITQGKAPSSHFAQACDELQRLLSKASWTIWPAAFVTPLSHWNQENLTLIGDAAHGTLPYLAQGAAMALEDAAELSDIFATELKSTTSKKFALLSSRRIGRTLQLHNATRAAGRIYHLAGFPAIARNAALNLVPTNFISNQQSWLYSK